MELKLFEEEHIDKQKASGGVWCDYGDGVELKLRRIGCPEAVVVRDRLLAELKDGYKGDKDIEEGDAIEIGKQIIAEAIVVEWKGISEYTEAGEEIEYPCTVENAYAMIPDENYSDLFIWISEQANNFENLRYNIRKRDEKK